jgi:hypothetical protein
MVATIQCASPPELAFTRSNLAIHTDVTLTMEVQETNGTLIPAFTLDGSIDFAAIVNFPNRLISRLPSKVQCFTLISLT